MSDDTARRSCSCHCGAVQFRARLPQDLAGIRCNCSICAAKGAVMVGLPRESLEVTAGQDVLSTYRFNTGVAQHHFCSRCGIHCFHQRRADPLIAVTGEAIHHRFDGARLDFGIRRQQVAQAVGRSLGAVLLDEGEQPVDQDDHDDDCGGGGRHAGRRARRPG